MKMTQKSQKKPAWRIAAFILGVAAIVVMWAGKDVTSRFAGMSPEQALPMVWEGYNDATSLVWRIGAICLLAFTCCMELKIQAKLAARRIRAQKEALPPQRTAVEEEARRLADSVCPPRF
jgi:hypothetical protein